MRSVMRAASFHICNAVILLSVITSTAADGSSQDPRGTKTLTLDAASTALPLVTGGEGYDLLGCFEQPPPNVPGGVLGSDDEYITLMPVPEGTFTIWSCLQGCATSTPKGQSEVHYSFAGIEDGRICFCGNALSEDTRKASTSKCDSPCAGDRNISCGGHGYVAVYAARTILGIDGDSSNRGSGAGAGETDGKTSPAEDEDGGGQNGIGAISDSSKGKGEPANTSGTRAAIIVGTLAGGLFLTALLFFLLSRYRRRKSRKSKTRHERAGSTTLHIRTRDANRKSVDWNRFDSMHPEGRFSPTSTRRTSTSSQSDHNTAESPRRRRHRGTAAPETSDNSTSLPMRGHTHTSTQQGNMPAAAAPMAMAGEAPPETVVDGFDHRRRYSTPYPPPGSYADARRASVQGDFGGVRVGPRDCCVPEPLTIRSAKQVEPVVASAVEVRFFVPLWEGGVEKTVGKTGEEDAGPLEDSVVSSSCTLHTVDSREVLGPGDDDWRAASVGGVPQGKGGPDRG